MAEAHSAVAFSFTVTSDGLCFDFNRNALNAVFASGLRAGKKRIARFKNSIHNQVYPFHPSSWFYFAFGVFAATYAGYDYAKSPIPYFEEFFIKIGIVRHHHVPACLLFSLILWFCGSMLNQLILRVLLSYKGWLFMPRGKRSLIVYIWSKLLKMSMSNHPRLYGYQYSLPSLPLPSLRDTLEKYLLSVQHLLPTKVYDELALEAEDFRKGVGLRLQFFLWLKTWFTSNYVSDWWEEYVYLSNRDPIMSNSNFYGVEWRFTHPVRPSQAARAAMTTHLLLKVRQELAHEKIKPLILNGLVPLCSWQYERPFNTTRVPGMGKDRLIHWADSSHVVVYHRGRYFRCPVVVHGHYLTTVELEYMFDQIINNDLSSPCSGEAQLAALTAGPREAWALARASYFSSGVNRSSLHAIENAAFFITLGEDPRVFDFDSREGLSALCKTLLTGNCQNIWFDKSFSLIVHQDSSHGINVEHSWGDAPIISHIYEIATIYEYTGVREKIPGRHYTENGSCDGVLEMKIRPTRLSWDIPQQCIETIESSYRIARSLADSIDLSVTHFKDYGRGTMKKFGFSPDAFFQVVLQLAYFMDCGEIALVYESTMTRMFREGRTETVRSSTAEVSRFIHAFMAEAQNQEECVELLHQAADRHQRLTREAISGQGVDRHLFALYIVSKFLRLESPFLKKILSEPWRLSTSQTSSNQTGQISPGVTEADIHRCNGGGFGPVDKNGYGVSYVFLEEVGMCFHVSSSLDCEHTSSERFINNLVEAMRRIHKLLASSTSKANGSKQT